VAWLTVLFALGCAARRFDYLVTESAPLGYPIEVVRGWVFDADGSVITYVPGSTRGLGWGEMGSRHIVGARRKPVPTSLDVLWFAFAEDRFYRVEGPLPHEEMLRMFREGTPDPHAPGERLPYDAIVVGMAPGGDVGVWMHSRRVVRRVATLRGAPVDVPWTAVLDNPDVARSDYVQSVVQRTRAELSGRGLPREPGWREEPLPAGRWGMDAARVVWAPTVAEGGVVDSLWVHTLDGEVEWIDFTGRADAPRAPVDRALPNAFDLLWTTPRGEAVRTEVDLDDRDVRSAFEGVVGPVTVDIVPCDAGDHVTVHVVRPDGTRTVVPRDVRVWAR
jgi:hypothetical protein